MYEPASRKPKRTRDERFWHAFWWNGGFVLLPFVLLLAVAWYIGSGIARDRAILSQWQVAQGSVISATVERCGKYGHTVRARYNYAVDGVDYSGDARAAGTKKCEKKELAAQLAVKAVGTPAQVFFDPTKPSNAVLGKPLVHTGRYVIFSICALLIAAFIALFAHALLSSPITNRDLTLDDIADDAARNRGSAHRAAPFKAEPPGK